MDRVWNQKSLKEFRYTLVFTSNHHLCASSHLHDVGPLYYAWLWQIMDGYNDRNRIKRFVRSICDISLLRNDNHHNLRLWWFLRGPLRQCRIVICNNFIILGFIVLFLYHRQDLNSLNLKLNFCTRVCELYVWSSRNSHC